jgi:hypothetical protein
MQNQEEITTVPCLLILDQNKLSASLTYHNNKWYLKYLPQCKTEILPHLPLREEAYEFKNFPRFVLSLLPKKSRLSQLCKAHHHSENEIVDLVRQCLHSETIGSLKLVPTITKLREEQETDTHFQSPTPTALYILDKTELETNNAYEEELLDAQLQKITGAQGLGGSWPKTFVESPYGSFIFKKYPSFSTATGEQIAKIETLSQQIFCEIFADQTNIGISPENTNNGILIPRFDKDPETNQKFAICHLADLKEEENIFKGSFEQAAKLALSVDPTCGEKFLNQVLYTWVLGDSDHHLENFAFIGKNDPNEKNKRTWELAPMYDTSPSRLFTGDQDLIALPVNNKKNHIGIKDWENLTTICGKTTAHVKEFLTKAVPQVQTKLVPNLPPLAQKIMIQHLEILELLTQGISIKDAELEIKKRVIQKNTESNKNKCQ